VLSQVVLRRARGAGRPEGVGLDAPARSLPALSVALCIAPRTTKHTKRNIIKSKNMRSGAHRLCTAGMHYAHCARMHCPIFRTCFCRFGSIAHGGYEFSGDACLQAVHVSVNFRSAATRARARKGFAQHAGSVRALRECAARFSERACDMLAGTRNAASRGCEPRVHRRRRPARTSGLPQRALGRAKALHSTHAVC
jgi:hypothetical protein